MDSAVAAAHDMGEPQAHLECVEKLNQLPGVETAVAAVGNIYRKLKRSNTVAEWTLGAAEHGVERFAIHFAKPIHLADSALCKSLDTLEHALPKVNPQQVLALTEPAMKRASVLLERSLEMAEDLLDAYLPEEPSPDKPQPEVRPQENGREKTAERLIRLRRTLHRRVTQHTLAQVKGLRELATEATVYLFRATCTAVSNPRESAQRAAELWTELSGDEPENQPPPQTLQERTVLLTREAARRLVHVINALVDNCTFLVTLLAHGVHLESLQAKRRYQQFETVVGQLVTLTEQIITSMVSLPVDEPNRLVELNSKPQELP